MSEVGVIVRCPTCKRTSAWSVDNAFRPFCSDRCRLIDLGAWLSETHRIPGDPVVGEDGEPPIDDRAAPR